MKEQVITARASNRNVSVSNGRASGAAVQRPLPRSRGSVASRPRNGGGSSARKALAYLPLVGKITLAVLVGVLLFAGYRAVAAASFFQARSVDVSGTTRVSGDEIKTIVTHNVAQTGVWKADLAAISKQLQSLTWVRSAVVSRVLPDGIRVRITERTPRAVARTTAGKLVWVDDEGVRLGTVSPSDHLPSFFIRGWDEAETSAARVENQARLQKYLELAREWSAASLSERVSEINLDDLRDVRAQLAGDDSQIEVRLGKDNLTARLRRALQVLDEQRNTPRAPFITYLDVTRETSTTVGHSSGKQISSEGDNAVSENAELNPAQPNPGVAREVKVADKSKENKSKSARKDKDAERQQKKNSDAKDKATAEAKAKTRPRRVG